MFMEMYFENMRAVLKRIEETQKEVIRQSAELIVDSLINGGVWHIFDTGHMLMYEAVGRAGGLMAVRPVKVSLEVSNPTRYREEAIKKEKVYMDEIEGLAEFIIKKSNMLPGDILVVGSVSGINILPIELTIRAREMEVTVIGLTSVTYSKFLESKHKSGKKLYEVCNIVLDNCCDVGDALVYVEELGQKTCPASGIAASYIMWALQAQVVELMLQKGKKPNVYISNHMPGAEEHNAKAWIEYEKIGY